MMREAWSSVFPTQISLYSLKSRLENRNFGFRKKRNCTIRVAKTKTLISCAISAQLICVFVFAHAVLFPSVCLLE